MTFVKTTLTHLQRPFVAVSIVAALALCLKVTDLAQHLTGSVVSPALAAEEKEKADEKSEEMVADKDAEGGDSVFVEAPADTLAADPAMMSQSELALLRDLGKRRAGLDAREQDLDMRNRLLEAAEKRVEGKISELKALEERVAALLVQHENQENEKLASIVKVYEKMKPADAARILEGLDMSIQVDVALRMSELRMAPILSKMTARGAQRLTTQLATKQVLDLGKNVN